MTGRPLRPTAQDRRRFADALRKLAHEMAETLAGCVGVHTPSRLEALAVEIESYALALVRARLGLLRVDGAASAAAARHNAGGGDTGQPSPAGERDRNARPCLTARSAYEAVPEDLDRFCQLTGVSPDHVGGQGSNLAGIAFYFRVFTILTTRRQIPMERLERLLHQLRHCREDLDAFVLRWTTTQAGLLGMRRKPEIEGVIRDLHSALHLPP